MRSVYRILPALLVTACASAPTTSSTASPSTASPPTEPTSVTAESDPTTEIVLPSDLAWEHLNPARGDKAPQAATLWGDRNGTGPTGFLLKPNDGFESPPHIHNVTYRGVVISGLIHNDHPDAERTWMPTGSYWTQPKGGVHITAAKGSDVLAIIEIETGPYLVRPTDEAFDDDESPKNVEAADIVWSALDDGVERAALWRDSDGRSGTLVKVPSRGAATLRSPAGRMHAVVIRGRPAHGASESTEVTTLEPGAYVTWTGSASHAIACEADVDCILYVRMVGGELELGSRR